MTSGPNDDDNRARALTLHGRRRAPAQPSALPRIDRAARAPAPLKLDGKLDEADWKAAQPTGPFVQHDDRRAGQLRRAARACSTTQTNLYVAFDVADDYLKSTFSKNDDHLWEQDAVELMIDPDGDEQELLRAAGLAHAT